MPPPVAPSRRFAYDASGDVLFTDNDAAPNPVDQTATYGAVLNNESNGGPELDDDLGFPGNGWGSVGVVFAEPKDIYGAFLAYGIGPAVGSIDIGDMEYSTDTTNGRDGTWAKAGSSIPAQYTQPSEYRDEVLPFFYAAVTGFRVRIRARSTTSTGNLDTLQSFHVYGVPGAGSDPDRLGFLDPITEYSSPKDYGDQGFGAEVKTQMAIKNKSGTLTAQTIALSLEGLTGDSINWYDLSIDDTVYTPTLGIGNIVPGGTTTFWLRQQIPPSGVLGLQAARVLANAGSWV